jgi:uncharacterized protein (DUF433 family)
MTPIMARLAALQSGKSAQRSRTRYRQVAQCFFHAILTERGAIAMTLVDAAVLKELGRIVTSDPKVLAGRAVFRGTRVPIEVLFENLADGMSLDEILSEYPTIDRGDAKALIHLVSAAIRSTPAP